MPGSRPGWPQTTLLNHILKEQSSKRIMVIENEVGAPRPARLTRHDQQERPEPGCRAQFGEISIDSDDKVMTRNETTEIVELPNGCACCDVQGELVDALIMIVRPPCLADLPPGVSGNSTCSMLREGRILGFGQQAAYHFRD